MLKVISADFDKGDYLVHSTVTGYFYQIHNYDGLIVDKGDLKEKPFYQESPTAFTLRGCKNESGAMQKIKRKIKAIEREFITAKLKDK